MPDSKITALTSISTSTDPANDPLVIVDVSDTSMAATGTTKKVTLNQLLGASGTATLASATITGDLTVDTNTLKVDSANNRVGVRTATPSYPLHVNGSDSINMLINGATKGIRFTADSGGSTIAGVDSTGNASYQPLILDGSSIGFQLSASTAMTLNSSGLGVGVSPAVKLDIGGAATQQFRIQMSGQADTRVISDTGAGIIGTYSNHRLVIRTNSADAVIVDASQNVGIGGTPSAWAAGFKVLQVGSGPSISTNGNASRCDISTNYYYNGGNKFLTASGYATGISQENGNFYFQRSTATSGGIGSSLTFDVPMTLDASGNLLVGVTAAPSGTIGGSGFISASNSRKQLNIATTSTASQALVAFINPNGVVGTIETNGSATAYNVSSDYRLKESVQPMTGALNRIAALKPSTYKWKVDGSSGEGFLAHELAQVVPLAVTGEKDAVNEDGSIKAQGVDLSKVVPVLVAAIQELAAEVNALKNA